MLSGACLGMTKKDGKTYNVIYNHILPRSYTIKRKREIRQCMDRIQSQRSFGVLFWGAEWGTFF